MEKLILIVTFVIKNLRKFRRYLKGSTINVNGLDMSDILDVKHTNFNGQIIVSGDNEDLNTVYHVKNGKLDLEYLKVKEQLKDK